MDTGVLGKIVEWDCVTEGTGIAGITKMGSGGPCAPRCAAQPSLHWGCLVCVEGWGDEEVFGEKGR